MEQLIKYLELLLSARITRTDFLTIPIAETDEQGRAIADDGECKAVILKFNTLVRNNTVGVTVVPTYCYYGDAKGQERELLRGVSSDIIFCTNLNQVWVRNPFAADIQVQAIVYK